MVIARIASRSALLGCLLLAAPGCSWLLGDDGLFPDTSDDYQTAPELPVLEVPEGKDSSALQEIYPIPAVEEDLFLQGEFEVPRPAPLVAGAADQLVRLQKLGDDGWALISLAPGQVWPQVRSFLAAVGVQVARVDARAGVMETDWLQMDGQPMASRFRFRIEQGVQRGDSELHVLQMHQAGDVNAWPATSDDFEQEQEMLRSVAQYIANSADTAPVSMIAEQAISATGKISLQEESDGHTYIRLGLPFDRAWASLSKALQESTFQVTDRDRSQGKYYVRFLGPQSEDDGGWFDWLFDEEEHPLAGKDFLVSVTSEDEDTVQIRLRPLNPDPDFGHREEQALLALIKGNIN